MKLKYTKKAEREADILQPQEARKLIRLHNIITQANSVREIPQVAYLKGTVEEYRIKLGKDYRVLVELVGNVLIIKSIIKRDKNTYKDL